MSNVIRCNGCNRNYIVEEFNPHSCSRPVITILDTDGNRSGSYDRIHFFPLAPFPKIPDDFLQGDKKRKSDEDLTEPLIDMLFTRSKLKKFN